MQTIAFILIRGGEQVYPAEEYQAVLLKAFGVLEHRALEKATLAFRT